MKVVVIATVTANGQLLLAENMAQISVPAQALGVFVEKALAAGNIVMGKATYNMIMQTPTMKDAFSGIDKVVLTNNSAESSEYKAVTSPKQAIEYLQNKGYETIVVAGGNQTYNSFLDADLVTDMYLSIVPVLIGNGGLLAPKGDTVLTFKLAEHKLLTDNIVQIHLIKNIK